MDAQLDLQVRYRQDFVPNKNCINLSSVIHHYKQVAHGTLFTGPLSYFARIYSSMQLCNFAVFVPQLLLLFKCLGQCDHLDKLLTNV